MDSRNLLYWIKPHLELGINLEISIATKGAILSTRLVLDRLCLREAVFHPLLVFALSTRAVLLVFVG